MSNRIYIDKEAYFALDEWVKYNAGYAIVAPAFFDKFEVHANEGIYTVVCYAEKKRYGFHVNVKANGKMVARLKISRGNEQSEHDFDVNAQIIPNTIRPENANEFLQFAAVLVLHTNAFLTYGNLEEDRVLIAKGKNVGKDKIIVFRKFENKLYAVAARSHRSPEGIFSVRGHFRRYKNGKTIWIDEYIKGKEKER